MDNAAFDVARPPPHVPFPQVPGYQIKALIGQGGSGTIYRASHSKLQRQVAIRILPEIPTESTAQQEIFDRKIATVGQLNHPNIVRAYDAGQYDGKHFLVMELIDGINLADCLTITGPLQIADACEMVRQIATALHHVREYGLIHRDIKPANLMLTRDGLVKILDLGLTWSAEDSEAEETQLTSSNELTGAIDEGAPVQINQAVALDIGVEINGLGVSFFQLLTGRCPRTDLDLSPNVPANIASLVRRMMASDPHDRIAEMSEVAAAVEPYCDSANLARLYTLVVAEGIECGSTPTYRKRRIATWGFVGLLAFAVAFIVLRREKLPPDVSPAVPDPFAAKLATQPRAVETTSSALPADPVTEREIAVWIMELGGRFETHNRQVKSGTIPDGDDWSITRAELNGRQFTDESLKTIAKLKRLDNLLITSPTVSGSGLAYLKDSSLKILFVNNRSRAQIEHICKIQSLIEVSLTGGSVSRDDLEILKRLPRLECLTLERMRITGEELAAFHLLSGLNEIALIKNNLSSDAFLELPELPRLTICTIAFNQIDDSAIPRLLTMTNLEQLAISETNVSDAGFLQLVKLPKLQLINVRNTSVTADGIEEFRRAIPNNRKVTIVENAQAGK